MSIEKRKLLVAGSIVAVLLLANVGAIVAWLRELGVLPLAEYLRAEYVTGTTIAVIVALLILLPSRAAWAVTARRCPVCDATMVRRGKYCAECGTRV